LLAAAGCGLDQFDHQQRREPHLALVLDRLLGCRERDVVAGEPVVQQRGRTLREHEAHASPRARKSSLAERIKRESVYFAAAERASARGA